MICWKLTITGHGPYDDVEAIAQRTMAEFERVGHNSVNAAVAVFDHLGGSETTVKTHLTTPVENPGAPAHVEGGGAA